MRPSQQLQKLKTVVTSGISENLIKTLWLEKLPEPIKNILVVSDENLGKSAVMADKISDMTPRTEIFASRRSSVCGEATSSKDQLLLKRLIGTNMPTQHSPQIKNERTQLFSSNAPSTFQRFINEVLFGLEFVFPYLDDILVAPENEEQHETHLKLVFDWLQKHALRVNISKSTLGITHLEFLGYFITPEGFKLLPEKVDAILTYKLPKAIRDLRTFLGFINFYRRYLKDAAKNQAILHEYLKG
ncbi:retrovirus-related Pol polyprotein from transposon opus [Trichonephila clavipes]|nr:retrovirus-related Pol polyprotein from transposon opus [Trichonephila clavipes]